MTFRSLALLRSRVTAPALFLLALTSASGGPPLPRAEPPGAVEEMQLYSEQFTRGRGAPQVFDRTFDLVAPGESPFFLRIVNGEENGTKRLSSASVWLNGNEIVGPANFNQNVGLIQSEVQLLAQNALRVRVASAPGSHMTVTFTATRGLPPDPGGIAPPLDLTVGTTMAAASSFLYEGPDPLQIGVAPGTIEPHRVAIVRGALRDVGGLPIDGAAVTIADHPELGRTVSRADGEYDLAVNGGGWLVVEYSKDGFHPAQRHVDVPWQDWVVVPDVVLTRMDAAATVVDLTSTTPIQVHAATPQTDDFGTRQVRLFFQSGTEAFLEMPGGSEQPISTLTVRATEYTVGEAGPDAMPAVLPATSGYTYCIELHADEAVAAMALGVRFTKPVIGYVDNFLDFPVGGIVPVGLYSFDQSAWLPQKNGVVLEVVGIENGVAAIDLDGSGNAAGAVALEAAGVTTAEVESLGAIYPVGQQLWRFPVTHFTPCDPNWPVRPPADAEPPPPSPPPPPPAPKEPPPEPAYVPGPKPPASPTLPCASTADPNTKSGSIIKVQQQVLGETLPVVGTPYELVYRSHRVTGSRILPEHIQISGPTVPASLVTIGLDIAVAGQSIRIQFDPLPNQDYTFQWNGLDAYGRLVQGPQPISFELRYWYDAIFTIPANVQQAFGLPSEVSGSQLGIPGRSLYPISRIWQRWSGDHPLDPVSSSTGFGGWTINRHHQYSPATGTISLGTGESVQDASIGATFHRNSLSPLAGFTETICAIAADGSMYYARKIEHQNVAIVRRDPDGFSSVVAGGGTGLGEGLPAVEAWLGNVLSVALGPEGTIFVAAGTRIRRIDASGVIRTVVGTGVPGNSGDGGPAIDARVEWPSNLSVDQFGGLYFSQREAFFGSVIRYVAPNGTISRVAGALPGQTGAVSLADAEGMLATSVRIEEGFGTPAEFSSVPAPWNGRVAADSSGGVYFSSHGSSLGTGGGIFHVGSDGIMTRLTAGGWGAPTLDGPARDAIVNGASNLVALPGRRLLFRVEPQWSSPARTSTIHVIDENGSVTRIAGSGGLVSERNVDGHLALRANLGQYTRFVVAPNGDLVGGNYRIVDVRTNFAWRKYTTGIASGVSTTGAELYEFDAAGRHLRTLSTLTGSTLETFEYDRGLLVAITDRNGRTTRVVRDGNDQPVAIESPFGMRTQLELDQNGHLSAVVDPGGARTTLVSDGGGLLTSMVDPLGRVHTFAYDDAGRLVRDDDPAGGSLDLERTVAADSTVRIVARTAMQRSDEFGIRSASSTTERTHVAPSGATTTTTSRSDGSVTTVRQGLGSVDRTVSPDPQFGMSAPLTTTVERTPSGMTRTSIEGRAVYSGNLAHPLQLWDQVDTLRINSATYTLHYDAVAGTRRFATPAGKQILESIDPLGRVVSQTGLGLATITSTYDGAGFLRTIVTGAGTASARPLAFGYGPDGTLASVEDALGRRHEFVRDAVGRVTAVVRPDGTRIEYRYDAVGNLLSLQPPGRPLHTFTYTPVDLAASYTAPSVPGVANPTISRQFNVDRQITLLRNPDGTEVVFSYDAGGRLSAIIQDDSTLAYSYSTGAGCCTGTAQITRLARTPSGGGAPATVDLGYDGSLLVSRTYSGAVSGAITWTYNNDFRVTAENVGGSSVVYQYDADGFMTRAGAMTMTRSAQSGLLTGTALGVVTTSYTYDVFGDVVRQTAAIQGNVVFAIDYVRDALSRIVRKVESIDGVPHTYDYQYDLIGRLIQVDRDGVRMSAYSYDANGNRLSRTLADGTTIIGSYDDQDRLLAYGVATFTHSANGAITSVSAGGNTTAYRYDAEGSLLGATLPGGTSVTYDLLEPTQRVTRAVGGTVAQRFLMRGEYDVAAELDGSGALVGRFVHADSRGTPAYVVRGGVSYRIITDFVGSPRLVVDTATGEVVQRMDFDEFGNVLADTNPGLQPFGFAGGLHDPATRLTHFGAREYDAGTGRWTSKDPIHFRGGDANLYAYCANDPVNRADPSGTATGARTEPERYELSGRITGEIDGWSYEISWDSKNKKTWYGIWRTGTDVKEPHLFQGGTIETDPQSDPGALEELNRKLMQTQRWPDEDPCRTKQILESFRRRLRDG